MPTPRLRAGHTDRQAAVDRLTRHFTEGRLDPSEFEERVGKAYAATHLDQLPELTADLPEDARRGDRPVPTWAAPPRPPFRRSAPFRRPPPVFVFLLVLAVALSIGAITYGVFPFPILWVLLGVFLISTRRHRRTAKTTTTSTPWVAADSGLRSDKESRRTASTVSGRMRLTKETPCPCRENRCANWVF